MEWLNYHHLLYFWTVVREGGVSRAAEKLRLAQPTVSAQVRLLEEMVGDKLFERRIDSLVSSLEIGKPPRGSGGGHGGQGHGGGRKPRHLH